MIRYDMCCEFDGELSKWKDELGEWVLYSEARAEINALKAEVEKFKSLNNRHAKALNENDVEVDRANATVDVLMAELAALKAPPKTLKAEEVTEAGYYWWRGEYKEWEPVRVDIDEFGVDVWRIMTEIPAYDGEWGKPYGEFIGPLKATEVTNT